MKNRLKYFLGNTPEEAEKTYKKFGRYLNKISSIYSMATGLEKGDLFGEAVLALSKAKASYEQDRGPFIKWASFKITDALNDFVANNSSIIHVPEYLLLANRLVNRLRLYLELCTDDNEVVNSIIYKGINELKMRSPNLPYWIEEEAEPILIKLERSAKRANISYEELVKRANFIPETTKVTHEFQEKELSHERQVLIKIYVSQMQAKMTDKEREISRLIMAGRSQKEIAKAMGKTPAWVSTQLKKMRTKFNVKGVFD